MLDSYCSDVIQENNSLRTENKNLRKENNEKDQTIAELRSEIKELLKVIGERSIANTKQKTQKIVGKIENKFADLIQHEDKKLVLRRLHELIDGKRGKDVGTVLKKATIDQLLTRTPKENEYKSEFELIGTWRAISHYMNNDKIAIAEIINNIKIL